MHFSPLALLLLAAPLGASPSPAPQAEEQRLIADDPQLGDTFGAAVAIEDDVAVIARTHRFVSEPGSVQVFRRGPAGFEFEVDLSGSSVEEDDFGVDLALDGNRLIVGAPEDSGLATDAGRAYIYEFSQGAWNLEAELTDPMGDSFDNFGSAVAIEGDLAVVGARGDEGGGAAHVFERVGGTWTHVQRIVSNGISNGDAFGSQIVINEDRLFVTGTGDVYVFRKPSNNWNQVDRISIPLQFIFGVAVEGDTMLLGVPGGCELGTGTCAMGRAFIYREVGPDWVEEQELFSSNRNAEILFGRTVDLVGGRAFVGALGRIVSLDPLRPGAAYLFEQGLQGWEQTQRFFASPLEIGDEYGASVAFDGLQGVVGAPGETVPMGFSEGAAYIVSVPEDVRQYCFGDGCPCNNNSGQAGCRNSSTVPTTRPGSLLFANGTTSVAADDLVLTASQLPSMQSGLLFMGAERAPVPFRDGLLCVGPGQGELYRFPVQSTGSEGAFSFGPGIAAFSEVQFNSAGQILAGSTFAFQVWFRDPGGPCGNGANLTNAVSVDFRP